MESRSKKESEEVIEAEEKPNDSAEAAVPAESEEVIEAEEKPSDSPEAAVPAESEEVIEAEEKPSDSPEVAVPAESEEVIESEEKPNLYHIEEFQPGDTVTVSLKIIEGERERTQSFEGDVISGSKKSKTLPPPGANFVVRRVSYGVGVERILPFHSPNVESVKVTRRGKVRRSKLYYLRGLTGRKARIKEKR